MAGEVTQVHALDGIRVVDLSQVAIGPYTTLMLAGLGADVIKVESNRRPDPVRGPVRPAGEQQMKQYPGGDPGERPWNRTAYFNQRNRGKLGITLDLADPRGKALLKQLVACCDVLVENFRASVMNRQGLGWDVLREVNPRLVYLKLSSQGNSGPERDYGSLGSTLEQTAGLVALTGYGDGPPLMTNETYPDPVGGIVAVGATIAALRCVRRTGHGCLVDFSQREMTVGMLGEAMLDYAVNGRVQGPIGNRSHTSAPQGVYPCLGEDSWIAISVETDGQWRALCELMGVPEWTHDQRFRDSGSRLGNQDLVDERVAAWTGGFEHCELTRLLQERGVPAGAVLNGEELIADPHLDARGWWEWLVPPEIGQAFPFTTTPWRMSGSPRKPNTPAPILGEHNDRVFLELLGVDAGEYLILQRAGVISTEPLWVRA